LAGVILMSALGHLVIGHENEIYGHFTCDDEVARFQWTRAQPPFFFPFVERRLMNPPPCTRAPQGAPFLAAPSRRYGPISES